MGLRSRSCLFPPGALAFEFAGARSFAVFEGTGFRFTKISELPATETTTWDFDKLETDFLDDDGNLDLGSFPLYWNRRFGLLEPFDVAQDGVFSHGSRVIQVFTLGHESG
jgi:hypothetical protein